MNDDEFLTTAGKLIQLLDTVERLEYWPSPIPSPWDQRIGEVCDLYCDATPLQRQVLVSALSVKSAVVLNDYAIRMAMASVRQNSETLLARGLVAHVIYLDWPWSDPRDSFFAELVLIYRSAVRVGINLDRLFRMAAQISIRQATRNLVYPPRGNPSREVPFDHVWWAETEGPAGLVYYLRERPIPEGHLTPVADRPSET